MKYIILCGGIGKRNNQYSLPKPMNYVNGKHLIEYIVSSIPSDEIYIIYNILLEVYHIKEILINKFKTKQFHFASIPFLTRGAVETAYIGLQSFLLQDDNILFIDNDNYHIFPSFPSVIHHPFIGYGQNFDKQNFSFITIKNKYVTNIEEKNKISDNYCCGLYGFKNKESFMSVAKDMIHSNKKTKLESLFVFLYNKWFPRLK
jgi:dTDP-glucose pyrophosphorylase